MGQEVTETKEYVQLQRNLKAKIRNFSLNSPEVVKISQKIDKYIVKAMLN